MRSNIKKLQVFLAMTIIGLSIATFTSCKNKVSEEEFNTLKADYETLQADHEAIKAEFANLQIEDSTLRAQLLEKDSVIAAKEAEIGKMFRRGTSNTKLKKELQTLRESNDEYLDLIESLKKENARLSNDLDAEKGNSSKLQKEKQALQDNIDAAAGIRAYNVKAEPLRVKRSGKEKVSYKAKKVKKIKVYFTLGENKLAPTGNRTLKANIIAPDGVLEATKDITYTGDSDDLTLVYNVPANTKLAKGSYKVEVYEGNNAIGSTSFELR